MKIKIYVVCHDDFYVPKVECLYPIQVGTCYAEKKIPGFLYDNDGDNISYKNKSYCELTALYWAWKNDDADYYGLFHYRRYLSFNPEHEKNSTYYRTYDRIDDYAIQDIGLNSYENIQKIVEDYDVIVPIANNISVNFENNYEQYCNSNYLHKKDLDIFLEVLHEKYPFLDEFANHYIKSHFAYFCNIGIMKKQYFNQYCEILFDVLEETENRCDTSNYSINELRVFGHLSERLFGIMFNYWLSTGEVRCKKLRPVSFLSYDKPTIQPAYSKNNIAIALSANNYYAYYLGVTIQSIIENADKDYNYDIIVIDGGINESNKTIILSQAKEHPNISIRFYKASLLKGNENLTTKQHMSVETWYRLYLPYILSGYDKIIYIDCDLVINNSLVELYKTKMGDHLVAGTRDLPLVGLYCDNHFVEYFNEKLKLKNPHNYVQAGVLILNLKQFKKRYTINELLEIATSDDYRWLDQDVINILANEDVLILNQKWNVEVNRANIRINQIKFCPAQMYLDYMEARKEPAIIHFSGEQKPWAIPEMDMAFYFWKYARRSPFYELILYRIMNAKASAALSSCNDTFNKKFNTLLTEKKNQNKEISDSKSDNKKVRFSKILPVGSKRRLFFRRIKGLFSKDIYNNKSGYWDVGSDIHMHNKITINKIKKWTGLWLFDKEMKRVRKLKNKHSGERCFITCTGPSLKISDLEKLSGEFTIGVNSIVRAYEKTEWRPTYYALVDVYAFGEYLQKNVVKGDMLATNNAFLHYRTKLLHPVGNELYTPISYYNHTEDYMKKNKMKFSNDPSVCVYDCFTVTNMAIQLAVYMGFKEIYLIGADCSYDPKKMHFIETQGIDDKQRNAAYLPKAVELSIKGYEAAKKFAEKHNVQIFNATRGGMLEVFERVDFDKLDLK